MDKIFISALPLSTVIGTLPEERELAQKIILELKDKFINLKPTLNISKTPDMPEGFDDIQNILLSLGYEEDEIKSAIKQVCDLGKNTKENEEFLRITLQILSA